MGHMLIRYNTESDAYYLTLRTGEVARTVHISDAVMVDVEDSGAVHGIELLCSPALLTADDRAELIRRFPVAEDALGQLEGLIRPPLSA
jgi:uncharacterized protein YuzE